ncbi:MAG: efflux RND transporter periplasmic adaptor subunit [Hyphomicrobiaceae bacterium]
MKARWVVWGVLVIGGAAFCSAAVLDPQSVKPALQTKPAHWVLEQLSFLKPYIPRTFAVAAVGETKAAPSRRGGGPPPPVRVARAETRSVPITLEGVGNVQARSTIAVKSRIDGQLFEALVKDGETVRKGDLLFRLDPRPFEAQLKQAEANLARDRANLAKAEADVARFGELARKGISPQTRLEEATTSVNTLRAAVQATQASIDLAKLNLSYATIRSPIDGRVGSLLVAPGNMVKANDTQALLVITETQPVYVAFGLAEQHIPALRHRLAKGRLTVAVTTQGWEGPPATGELFFINNAVDMNTGTIQVMARFANADERLLPGQFVRASVELDRLENAVVVPSQSVQINQKGHYVWVMQADNTVKPVPIAIGPEAEGRIVIEQGLSSGAQVVTDGQLRLFPGAKVAPVGGVGGKNGKGKAQS